MPLPLANLASLQHFPHSPFLHPPPFSPFAASHPHPLIFHPGFHPALYQRHLLEHAAFPENNNDVRIDDHNTESSKRFFLDEVLKNQARPQAVVREEVVAEKAFVPVVPEKRRTSESPFQENPMDLSVKSDGRSSSTRRRSDDSEVIQHDNDEESASNPGSASEEEEISFAEIKRIKLHPLDLTTKV